MSDEMVRGYPTLADIQAAMTARGLEIPVENNPNHYEQFWQFLYGIINAFDFAGVLGVYAATPTTFNVRGGQYLFKNTVKTYTPGDAVDPVNDDTTYIWLTADNAVGSGIDGDGWPNAEHVKLAEIVVNASGVITAITDLRGRAFMQYFSEQNLIDKIVTYHGEVVVDRNGNVVTYG